MRGWAEDFARFAETWRIARLERRLRTLKFERLRVQCAIARTEIVLLALRSRRIR